MYQTTICMNCNLHDNHEYYYNSQLRIPDDLEEVTNELLNAVDLADTDEDQSEENLNFVFDIIKSVADNCIDNVSADE